MNCAQTEVRIYLYNELAPPERKKVDRHLATCRSCAELHHRVNEDRVAMKRILEMPVPTPDYPAITRQVMRAVGKSQRKNLWLEGSFRNPLIHPVRYAFTLLSIILVAAFVVEQGRAIDSPGEQTVASLSGRGDILLHSESFHRSLVGTRNATKISLYDCVVRCLQTGEGNCRDCKFQVSKYN